MAKTSTLGSPGVEVIEINNTQRTSTSTSGAAFITGFANQGPTEEVNAISTIDDFVDIYGKPTNAAERYFYNGVQAFLNGSGNGYTLYTSRLPYGADTGNITSKDYTLVAFPAKLIKTTEGTGESYSTVSSTTTENLCDTTTILLTAPKIIDITEDQYQSIMSGEFFSGKEVLTYKDGTWYCENSLEHTFNNGDKITVKGTEYTYDGGNWSSGTGTYTPTEGDIATSDISKEWSCSIKDTISTLDDIKNAAFILINSSRTTVSENFEGFYLGMTDNMFTSLREEYGCETEASIYNAVENVKVRTSSDASKISDMAQARLGFKVSGLNSMSTFLERDITTMDITGTSYDDTLSLGLFKLSKTTTSTEAFKLSYTVRESYNASLGSVRVKSSTTSTKPVSYYIEDIVNTESNNINVLVNPYVAKKITINNAGIPGTKVRILGTKLRDGIAHYMTKYENDTTDTLKNIILQAGITKTLIDTLADKFDFDYVIPFGVYQKTNEDKKIGNVPYKVGRALQLVENDEEYQDMDLIVDNGLSTIYAYSSLTTNGYFDDTITSMAIEDLRTGKELTCGAATLSENYNAVIAKFLTFCNSQASGGRGDAFFLGDVLRGTMLKGKNTKVSSLFGKSLVSDVYAATDNVNHSWSTSVYYPIKHTTDGITTTYASIYAQWLAIIDDNTSAKQWCPVSPYIAALMASTDQSQGPWYAAAGMNRGVIQGVIDYAISSTQAQRTDLYKICINSVPKLPSSGITVWGIRTMSKMETAFDQNTCRRTFLYMEKRLKRALRYFLFEPNTAYTRLSIYNDLKPFMDNLVTNSAVYSYTLVCDSSINTEDIINNGDLAVEVSAAPTRTAERIRLSVTANRYDGTTTVS